MRLSRSLCNGLLALTTVVASSCSDPKVEATGNGTGGGANNGGGSSTGGGGSSGGVPKGAGMQLPDNVNVGGGANSGGGNPDPNQVCAVEKFSLERLPPELLLLLDRSKSMTGMDVVGKENMITRWDEMRPAMAQTVAATVGAVSWGLQAFPRPAGCQVGDIEVPVAANNTAVSTSIDAMQLNGAEGGTPTSAIVRKGTQYLKTLTTKNPKFLLLATDGEPTCSQTPGVSNDRDATNAVAEARMAGFDVFVVGILSNSGEALRTLNALAEAGGRARAADPKFYSVGNRDELAAAVTKITADIATCLFTLNNTPPDPMNVGVEIAGKLLPRTEWSYGAGMKSIQLGGAACDKVKQGGAGDVRILFGCPNAPIP